MAGLGMAGLGWAGLGWVGTTIQHDAMPHRGRHDLPSSDDVMALRGLCDPPIEWPRYPQSRGCTQIRAMPFRLNQRAP